MMTKYSKFGFDTFIIFYVMGSFKDFAWQQQQRSSDHNSSAFIFETNELKIISFLQADNPVTNKVKTH